MKSSTSALCIVLTMIVVALSINSVNLHLANRDHVRTHADLVWRLGTANNENTALANDYYYTVERHKMEISSKDVKIKKLIQIVAELYQIIKENTNKDQDRVT